MRIANNFTPVKYNKINNQAKKNYPISKNEVQTQVSFSGFAIFNAIKKALAKEKTREQTIKLVKEFSATLNTKITQKNHSKIMEKQFEIAEKLMKSLSILDAKHCSVLKPILSAVDNLANGTTLPELKKHILTTFGDKMTVKQLEKLVVPIVKNPDKNYTFVNTLAVETLMKSKKPTHFKPVITEALQEQRKNLPYIPVEKEKLFLKSLLNSMRTIGKEADKDILKPFLHHMDSTIKSITQNVINSLS